MRLPKKRLFRRGIALAIAIAHLVVVIATAAEALRASASAHIEQRGTQSHYAHNEATCPIWAAQAILPPAEPYVPPPAITYAPSAAALVERVDRPALAQ